MAEQVQAPPKQVKIRSFLAIQDKASTGGIGGDPVKAMTTAINRMGFIVEDIGKLLTSITASQVMPDFEAVRQQQLERDKQSERDIELGASAKDIEKGVDESKIEKPKMGWLDRLLQPFVWLAKTALTWFVLDWLSKPQNTQTLITFFKVVKVWFKTLAKVTFAAVDLIMSAFGEKNPVIGALKLVAGIGALFLADRILKPWKLLGDAGKLANFVRSSIQKGAKGPAIAKTRADIVRQRAKNIARIRQMRKLKAFGGSAMRGAGRFLRGGGLSALAGVGAAAGHMASGSSVQVAVGAGAGATIGGLAMSAVLTPILGPFGPIVGQVLGSFIGEKIGAFMGDAITPIIEPLRRYFTELALPLFKAFLEPVVKPFIELWKDGIVPVFNMLGEFLKPLADTALQKMFEFLNSPIIPDLFKKVNDWVANFMDMVNNPMKHFQNLGRNLQQGADDVVTSIATQFQQAFGINAGLTEAEAQVRKQERSLATMKDQVKGDEDQLKYAKEKLAFLENLKKEKGANYVHIGLTHPDPLNNVGKRIETEKQHIANLQQRITTTKTNISVKESQIASSKKLVESYKAETAGQLGPTAAGSVIFPLPKGRYAGGSGQKFGDSRSYGGHAGLDLTEKHPFGKDPQIPVVAAIGGTVLKERYNSSINYLAGMMIQGEDGYDQRYLHMLPSVKPGQKVTAGQRIGKLLDLGRVGYGTDATHLHFEVYKRGSGKYLDPRKVYPNLFNRPNQHRNIVKEAPEKAPPAKPTINNGRTAEETTKNLKDVSTNTKTKPSVTGGQVLVQPVIRRAGGVNEPTAPLAPSAVTGIRGV